jgi:hypothetical protein
VKQAREFWLWFATHDAQLRRLSPSSAEWQQLDAHVSALGFGSWEIGPAVASTAQYMFALSPQGDPDKFARAQRIIGLAPEVTGWEFLPAKPRKLWRRQFEWSTRHVSIDARNWQFVVYRYDDGKSELVLLGDPLRQLPETEQESVLTFVVESELGEGLCIDRICGLDIARHPTPEDVSNATPIASLFQVVSGTSAH